MSGAGVSLFFSPSTRVIGNSLTGSGIGCRSTEFAPESYFGDNTVTGAGGVGILMDRCPAVVRRNVASGNAGSGFERFRSSGDFVRNLANGNGGSGIEARDSHGTYSRNITNGNAGFGFVLSDQNPAHGPFHTIADHVAMANGQLAIAVFNLQGVIEDGENRARANGDPLQCFGISCN
jgi:Right handed beta helix region